MSQQPFPFKANRDGRTLTPKTPCPGIESENPQIKTEGHDN